MNLSKDFISIQGIFLSIEKNTTKFTKIKYKGGNEAVIQEIETKLQEFLTSENYLINCEINRNMEKQLQEIIIFLILNTELRSAVNDEELQHLVGIMPKLSCCLLVNIIIDLKLAMIVAKALMNFELNVVEEILTELVSCLRNLNPKTCTSESIFLLELILQKLSNATDQKLDEVEKFTKITSQILLNFTSPKQSEDDSSTTEERHQQIGFNLVNLLNLVTPFDVKSNIAEILKQIFSATCSLVMTTSIDVFVTWAEVKYEDENLQLLVGEKSYLVVEKFERYEFLTEFIKILSSMAKKPRSINEQITMADTAKKITMINKADANQKKWFSSLLNSEVFTDEAARQCLEQWTHLCSLNDVMKLLSMVTRTGDKTSQKIVLKCAENLNLENLSAALTDHFHAQSKLMVFEENIQQELVVIFNKSRNDFDIDSKRLLLLFLKNPEQTLSFIFGECLKNSYFTKNLAGTLPHLKEASRFDDLGFRMFINEINSNKPSEHNYKNYIELLNMLLKINFYQMENIVNKILLPLITNEEDDQVIKHTFLVINGLEHDISISENTKGFLTALFTLLRTNRCNFFQFDAVKQDIVNEIVLVLLNKSKVLSDETVTEINDEGDLFESYYKKYLLQADVNILDHFQLKLKENYAESIARMIQVFPRCIKMEWREITNRLAFYYGVEKSVKILCDAFILVADIVNSQANKTNEVEIMLNALRYSLQNLGIVLKNELYTKIESLDQEVEITWDICRLIQSIPIGEGLSLTNLLSGNALKALNKLNKFPGLLKNIKDNQVRSVLHQKIL